MDMEALCTQPLVALTADSPVHEAAALMCRHHVGAVAVVSNDDPATVLGIVTDRDLALEVVGRAASTTQVRVGDLAKSPPVAIRAEAGIGQALAAMDAAGVRRLLVVDGDGVVSGVVSADDIVAAIAQELGGLAHALHSGMARESSERAVADLPAQPRLVYPAFGTVASQ